MSSVRVRFAPSPTGPLHIGGLRTALFNYLFAKKNKGTFILRIEDTDTNRYVEGAEEYIIESLQWSGLEPDESPIHGGNYGPYRQSERKEIYQQYTQQLLDSGYGYLAFDTPEELDQYRKEYEARGEVFSYNAAQRKTLRNSEALSEEEVQKLMDEGKEYVVRFKMPEEILYLNDIIRGEFDVDTQHLDDKVLVKADGMPTYHFANIIDDHLMEITHVIRGEEWLPSMPLHVLLYRAMGWNPPQFAHLPLILKPVGNGKLSKRDGAKMGFPVFPLQWEENGEIIKGYKEEGYFPETVVNFLALLGWTPSNEKEVLSLSELIDEFDLEKVHKSGARFDPEKNKWFNQQYLQLKKPEELLIDFTNALGGNWDNNEDKALYIISLMKERVHFVQEMAEESLFFYVAPSTFNENAQKRAIKPDTIDILKKLLEALPEMVFDSADAISQSLKTFATTHEKGMGAIMMPLRLALVGDLKGPDVPIIMQLLGKEEVINRVQFCVQTI